MNREMFYETLDVVMFATQLMMPVVVMYMFYAS